MTKNEKMLIAELITEITDLKIAVADIEGTLKKRGEAVDWSKEMITKLDELLND